MTVSLTRYEVGHVVDPLHARRQAEVLGSAALPGMAVDPEVLELLLQRHMTADTGEHLAIELPEDQPVDPVAVIHALQRVA